MKSLFKENFIKPYKYLGALIVLILFISGCTFLPKEEPVLAPPLTEPAELDYNTAEVTRGDIAVAVQGVGSMIPKNNTDLHYTSDGGRLKEILVAEGDKIEKGQILAEVETGNLAFDIQQAELELQKAKIRLNQMNANADIDKYTKEIAELDVQGQLNRLTFLRNQMEASKLTSPLNGVVTFVADIRQGEAIQAYHSIFQVAETSELQLQYQGYEPEDVSEVTLGMEATIEFDGENYAGEVVQTPKSVPLDISKEDPDFYSKTILINIEDMPKDIAYGNMIKFQIVTAEKEDTLMIPRSALRTVAGQHYVQLLTDNTKREINIEAGIMSSTEVEILDGLEEGDVVIIR